MNHRVIVGLGLVLSLGLSGCGKPAAEVNYVAEPERVAITATPEGRPLSVPSDPGAHYYVVDKARQDGNAVIITQRIGSSGVSYSSRLYDCVHGTAKYLGMGDTRAAMEASKPEPAMWQLTSGSISYYVGLEACR